MEEYDRVSIDGRLGFTESNHKYTLLEDPSKYFKSVTSLLKDYKEPFDAIAISESMVANPKSEYFGMDPQVLRDEWKASAARGTLLHSIGEALLKGEEPELIDDPAVPHLIAAVNELKKQNYKVAATEMLVYDEDLQVAGSSDIILKKGDDFMIYDFKFIKQLNRTSYFDVYKRDHKRMTGPFKYLHDCNYIHYSIQLAIYQTLTGEPERIKEKVLVVVTPDSYEFVPCYPMRVYWNEYNELHAVYERRDKKWYVSANGKSYKNKPNWIKGL